MDIGTLQAVWAPRALSILRIIAALIFLEHGTQKLLGFPAHPSRFRQVSRQLAVGRVIGVEERL